MAIPATDYLFGLGDAQVVCLPLQGDGESLATVARA